MFLAVRGEVRVPSMRMSEACGGTRSMWHPDASLPDFIHLPIYNTFCLFTLLAVAGMLTRYWQYRLLQRQEEEKVSVSPRQ